MTHRVADQLRSTFRQIADGKLAANHFGTMVKAAITNGLTTHDAVADILGVQKAHVFCKANALKSSEVKELCKKLAL